MIYICNAGSTAVLQGGTSELKGVVQPCGRYCSAAGATAVLHAGGTIAQKTGGTAALQVGRTAALQAGGTAAL